jgi:hypothetical protein
VNRAKDTERTVATVPGSIGDEKETEDGSDYEKIRDSYRPVRGVESEPVYMQASSVFPLLKSV